MHGRELWKRPPYVAIVDDRAATMDDGTANQLQGCPRDATIDNRATTVKDGVVSSDNHVARPRDDETASW